ncbi:882_t:CDS:2 [Cetraspora pellucida]|uniref:882_t:CDS:1 n=1 Tax=Cetraspora pellucida TaxID=1433469 RepID=A0A9N9F1P2_9GLOM|nr:882_t:CDS:2 [Cetraspora pellucida]
MAEMFEKSNHTKYINKVENTSLLTSFKEEKDAASMSNWLDSQKEHDPQWIVVRDWDKDNILTKLLWMTPEQVENWIQFSDCILNDVTYKTNCYSMVLLLFVEFNQILKATNKQPAVIITDADPAVDSTVCQVFVQNYPIHYAFHMIQNINKHLRNLLASNYENFIETFYICRNSFAKETFERSDDQEIEIPDASVADIQQILLKELIHLVERLNNVIEADQWALNTSNQCMKKEVPKNSKDIVRNVARLAIIKKTAKHNFISEIVGIWIACSIVQIEVIIVKLK